MRGKIEKEEKNSKNNRRLIQITGILVIIYLVSLFTVFEGSAFRDFCESAIRWVLIGIGVASSVTSISQEE